MSKKITFGKIYKDLTQSISWLDQIGINTSSSRFENLKKEIYDLVLASEKKTIGRFSNREDYKSGVHSLVEAKDLINIHNAFKNKVGNKLVETLSIAVKGDVSGTVETVSNNKARNALAELSWGALLENSNYSISHEYTPDIIQFLDFDKSIVWEVKRPLSIKKLEKRLKEGGTQINKVFENKVGVGNTTPIGGCIVIFVENILGYSREIVFDSENRIMDIIVRKELKNWWDDNKPNKYHYYKHRCIRCSIMVEVNRNKY